MSTSKNIAKHFREVYFGGNWTVSCLKDQLEGISWQQAVKKVEPFNTIVMLTYHIHYFPHAVLQVLNGGPLDSKDEFSFDHPPIESDQDWQNFLDLVWKTGQEFADKVEALPDDKIWQNFVEEKYGIYFRNLSGIIEHTHYHLGQIALVKKLV